MTIFSAAAGMTATVTTTWPDFREALATTLAGPTLTAVTRPVALTETAPVDAQVTVPVAIGAPF